MKPAQPLAPFLRPLGKLRLRLRLHSRIADGVRSQPPFSSVRCGVEQGIEFVIATECERRALFDHVANDVQCFTNGGTTIDVVSEEERLPLWMSITAGVSAIPKTREQATQRGSLTVDVADDVVRFIFHTARLERSALGKQGRFRNNVDSMDKFSALFAKGGLSLDRLRTLCLVAEAGSLTAAADRDPTRVSLFSRQLRELESFFGARLARRRGKKIALTDAGHELAGLARRHFIALTDFARRCTGKPLDVRLGAGASVTEWILMPQLPALRKALRGSQVKLIRERSELLATRVRDLRLDVAIVREDAVVHPLKTLPFAKFGYALFVPRRLMNGSPRHWKRWLPQLPLISPTEGWTRERVDAAATAAGLELRIEVEGASATLAVRALREGHYAAILPKIASTELAGADVVTLQPAFLRSLERHLVIAWHPRQAETRAVTMRAVEAIRKLGVRQFPNK